MAERPQFSGWHVAQLIIGIVLVLNALSWAVATVYYFRRELSGGLAARAWVFALQVAVMFSAVAGIGVYLIVKSLRRRN
jgi:hypothetical protein